MSAHELSPSGAVAGKVRLALLAPGARDCGVVLHSAVYNQNQCTPRVEDALVAAESRLGGKASDQNAGNLKISFSLASSKIL